MKVIDISEPTADGADAVARSSSHSDAAGHSLGRDFDRIIDSVVRQSDVAQSGLKPILKPVLRPLLRRGTAAARLRHAIQQMPLMRAERTYDTSHLDYDRHPVRDFPGRIFNHNVACDNAAFRALARLGRDVPAFFNAQDPAWTIEGEVYEFVRPEGRISGWLVPEPDQALRLLGSARAAKARLTAARIGSSEAPSPVPIQNRQ
jgi:hypothetical protein